MARGGALVLLGLLLEVVGLFPGYVNHVSVSAGWAETLLHVVPLVAWVVAGLLMLGLPQRFGGTGTFLGWGSVWVVTGLNLAALAQLAVPPAKGHWFEAFSAADAGFWLIIAGNAVALIGLIGATRGLSTAGREPLRCGAPQGLTAADAPAASSSPAAHQAVTAAHQTVTAPEGGAEDSEAPAGTEQGQAPVGAEQGEVPGRRRRASGRLVGMATATPVWAWVGPLAAAALIVGYCGSWRATSATVGKVHQTHAVVGPFDVAGLVIAAQIVVVIGFALAGVLPVLLADRKAAGAFALGAVAAAGGLIALNIVEVVAQPGLSQQLIKEYHVHTSTGTSFWVALAGAVVLLMLGVLALGRGSRARA